MTHWLDPLRRVLDQAAGEITLFFRDDDAGWDDDALYRLLERFTAQQIPIDLAVIPQELGSSLTAELLAHYHADPDRLGLHQHGYRHVNHESEGRKHEFGPSRERDQQFRDLRAGRDQLETLLGDALDPIFTPPWNRCTEATTACLAELGYSMLSRDRSARPLPMYGLAELPVGVDWLRRRQGERITRQELGQTIAGAVRAGTGVPVGIMLHHAAMDTQDLADVGELLTLLSKHDNAACRAMRHWLSDSR